MSGREGSRSKYFRLWFSVRRILIIPLKIGEMGYLEIIEIQSRESIDFMDITLEIQEIIERQGIEQGIVLVYTPHTTAGITINENADPAVKVDIREFLKKKIPSESYYRHLEGNSPSHIMSSLFSASETLVIEKGRLLLGTWQGIFFCEFDGPRKRKVYVKVLEG
jgi:secondary thiamine-phosphate synthase enzyme